MKKYVCFKRVMAEPMTRNTFHDMVKQKYDDNRNGDYHIDEWSTRYNTGVIRADVDAPGYHVVYGVGTPNEYHSWSPAQAFESGYVEMDESGESAIQKVSDILTTEAMDRIGNIHEKLQTVFK